MKGSHPRITLLGSNSGNNLGDAAILSGILDSVSKVLPDAEFYVPSTNPEFTDKHYKEQYRVKGVNVMPWTGSIRLFGIPTIRCFAKSDIALICDGIIFGKKLLNPTFNFLITLVALAPFAKLLNCKLVCYSCGIGPFPTKLGEWCAKYVMNMSDLVIMRENDSAALAKKLGCIHPIEVTGDAAFINPVSDDSRAEEILEELGSGSERKPLFGINVTKYFDAWLRPEERVADKKAFLEMLAEGINSAREQCDFQPVLFSTHPMDEAVANELAGKIGGITLTNSKYLSHDIQAVMRRCELFIGMRFHSLVLSSAVGCPIIGLVYAPKVRGYMRLLNCEDFSLELSKVDATRLAGTITTAWNDRESLKQRQQVLVEQLKTGAREAAELLGERYFQGSQRKGSGKKTGDTQGEGAEQVAAAH